jgi:hypothetical protein
VRLYNDVLAAAIGGFVHTAPGKVKIILRNAAGATPKVHDLLHRHGHVWFEAMQIYIDELDSGSSN